MNAPGAASLIRRKRDGATLDAAQLHALAQGVGDGSWSEGQIGAFAMAVAWRGMAVHPRLSPLAAGRSFLLCA